MVHPPLPPGASAPLGGSTPLASPITSLGPLRFAVSPAVVAASDQLAREHGDRASSAHEDADARCLRVVEVACAVLRVCLAHPVAGGGADSSSCNESYECLCCLRRRG